MEMYKTVRTHSTSSPASRNLVPESTLFESRSSFKSAWLHQSPGTPLDLQTTALQPSTYCHYTDMCRMPSLSHTHIYNMVLGVHRAPCQTQQKPIRVQRGHAQNIRQRRRTKREAEDGLDAALRLRTALMHLGKVDS